MSLRKEFRLTAEQKAKLLEAMKPVAYIAVAGHPPISQQENANHAWQTLGQELGFKFMTVRPVPDKSDDYFTAEVEA